MVSSGFVENVMLELFQSLLADPLTMPIVLHEYPTRGHLLPSSFKKQVDAAQAITRVLDAGVALEKGKSTWSLVELTTLLRDAHVAEQSAPKVYAMKEKGISVAIAALKLEWVTSFKALKSKCAKAASNAISMKEKFGNIVNAIAIWDFKDCDWITSQKEQSPEDQALFKAIEAAVPQLTNRRQLLERSKTDEEQKVALTAEVAKLDGLQKAVDETATISTYCILACALHGDDKHDQYASVLENSSKHVRNVLKVDTTQLHENLLKHVAAAKVKDGSKLEKETAAATTAKGATKPKSGVKKITKK